MDYQAHYKINVDGSSLAGAAANAYKQKVTEHLNWIYRTQTGKILLDCIRFHGKKVTITPYTAGDCNAVGGWKTVGGVVEGTVAYSPGTFGVGGACPVHQAGVHHYGQLWDEILFHELVHVFRGVSGKWNKVPLGFGLTYYDDTEEFYAVLLTNIYISDRSNKIKTGLRGHHQGFGPLEANLADSYKFFASSVQVVNLVQRFIADNAGISAMLKNVNAPFNPIAAYQKDPGKAQAMSRQAGPRDIGGLTVDLANWAKRVIPFAS
jgi:hypothetical protein